MPDRESSPSVVVPRMPTREGPQEGGSVCAATLAEAAAIDLDLERTFSHLSSAASGREEAKILLNRFVEEHPDVGYTQGMNYGSMRLTPHPLGPTIGWSRVTRPFGLHLKGMP